MRPNLRFTLAAALGAVLATSSPSNASDHVDGVKTAIDNAADVTDFFAFTSPSDPTKLVMIMNVHGLAFSTSRFSQAVDYVFRIRPIEDARNLKPSDGSKERSIVCNFAGGTVIVEPNQRATCSFSMGASSEVLSFDTRGEGYRAGGSGQKNGLRVFAGVRSDPWFLDLAKTVKINNGLPLLPIPGVNGLYGQNVLSIVVEVPKQMLPSPIVAVVGQTVRK